METKKLSSLELKELSWFDCQLLEMILGRTYHIFDRHTLMRGTSAYVFWGDLHSISYYDYFGHLDSAWENLSGLSTNISGLLNKLMPYTFIAMHKVLDILAEWIIGSVEAIPWGFKSKIRRLKELSGTSTHHLPKFFTENPLLHDVYIKCYESFTELRNQAAHTPHIHVDQYGTLSFTFKDGTIKQMKSREMDAAMIFTKSLIACLTEEDSLSQEITKRRTYLAATALSNFHHTNTHYPISACWWSQVQFGFNKTPDEIQDLQSVEINLDAIKQAVLQHKQPEDHEEVRLDVSVHLEDPYSQPNYKIPFDRVAQGGIMTIDRKDFYFKSADHLA